MKKTKKRLSKTLFLLCTCLGIAVTGNLVGIPSVRAQEQFVGLSLNGEATNIVPLEIELSETLFKDADDDTIQLEVQLPKASHVDLAKIRKENQTNPHFLDVTQEDEKLIFELTKGDSLGEVNRTDKLLVTYSLANRDAHVVTAQVGSSETMMSELEVEPTTAALKFQNRMDDWLPKPDLPEVETYAGISRALPPKNDRKSIRELTDYFSVADDSIIDAEYSFRLKWTADTEVVYEDTKEPIKTELGVLSPKEGELYFDWYSMKNGSEIRYTNVGFYNGQELDLIARKKSGERKHQQMGVSARTFLSVITEKPSGSSHTFNLFVDLIPVKTGTTDVVPIKGNMRLDNISELKYVHIPRLERIVKLVTPIRNTNLQYGKNELSNDPFPLYGVGLPQDTSADKLEVTYVYKELEKIPFGFALDTVNHNNMMNGRLSYGSETILRIAPPAPVIKGNKLEKDKEPFYRLTQFVPAQKAGAEFATFKHTIEVEQDVFKPIEAKHVKVLDGENKEYSPDQYEVTIDGEKVEVSLSPELLKGKVGSTPASSLYDNYMYIELHPELDYTQDYSRFDSEAKIRVPLKKVTLTPGAKAGLSEFEPVVVDDPILFEREAAEANNKMGIEIRHLDKDTLQDIIPPTTDIGRMKYPYDLTMDANQGAYVRTSIEGDEVGDYPTEPGSLTRYYQDNRFELSTELAKKTETGSELNPATVQWSDELTYTIKLKSHVKPEESELLDKDATYQTLAMAFDYPSTYLDTPTSIKLVNSENDEVGTAELQNGKIVVTSLNPGFNWQEDLKLVVTAQVIVNSKVGDVISITPTSSATFDKNGLPSTLTSDESKVTIASSVLEVKELPTNIEYGSDNIISLRKQEIPIRKMDGDVIIQDNREVGNKWSVNLAVKTQFSGTDDTNHILADVMKFKKGTNYETVSEDGIEIFKQETDLEHKVHNLTKDWIKNKEGLVLVIPAGGVARADTYNAELIWTVNDTPEN